MPSRNTPPRRSSWSSLVWVVTPSLPVKTLKELVDYAKANPGKLTYASSGAGAPQRMCAELFRLKIGADMIHVPYKGSGPAMSDLVGGQVVTMCDTVPASLQLIKAGKLRALAVTMAERISMLPDVPTAARWASPGSRWPRSSVSWRRPARRRRFAKLRTPRSRRSSPP